MGVAFGANLALAAVILATFGSGDHGTSIALRATARVAFLWFFAAYVGGALSMLFYPHFQSLRPFGRELGLAFAAALVVHLALVGWLCWIGQAPEIGVFTFFGLAPSSRSFSHSFLLEAFTKFSVGGGGSC